MHMPCNACAQSILAGLRQEEDETAQLSALSELCELLSISTEESLASFPIESIVPLLVSTPPAGLHWSVPVQSVAWECCRSPTRGTQ